MKEATTELFCTFTDAGLRQQLSHSRIIQWGVAGPGTAVGSQDWSDQRYQLPYKMVKGSCSAQKAAVNIDGYVTLADSATGVAGNTVTLLKVRVLHC